MKKLLLKVNDWLIVNSDKVLHFTIGGLIFFIVFSLLVLSGGIFYFWEFMWMSLFIVLLVGILKEVLDNSDGKKADFLDILATITGGAAMFGIMTVSKIILT